VRLAFDLYNRGIAEGLATPDGEGVRIGAGRHELPFGVLDVEFDPVELRWAGYRFEGFAPAAHLEVKGLRNRYRRRGIGAPLAASIEEDPDAPPPPASDRIPEFVKVPVSAVLRLNEPQDDLASGTVHATLELYARDETPFVTIHGREVPLEFETSSSLAYSLQDSWFWDFDFAGFRSSDLLPIELEHAPDRLLMLEPYRPGRIPLVLVHGTASSPGTWAELVNEIENDPELGNRYQVWLFVYYTGSPILYSAGLLRQALAATVEELDPEGDDPALRRMVVIGHSQGGLIAKLLVVSSGDDFWHNISDEPLDAETADPGALVLLERSTYFEPAPAVERVVFIATPHRGTPILSRFRIGGIASWVIKLPSNLLMGVVQLARRDPKSDAVGRLKRLRGLPTSIDDMTPGNPMLRVLEHRPIAPGVSAHSIIAVRGDSAPEDGGDGVVSYSSAHIEGVESELVVRSGHSTQQKPPSIEEVRRILLLHGDARPQ
jgi:pimeloyl-ACP methyl ester carboxylesterase